MSVNKPRNCSAKPAGPWKSASANAPPNSERPTSNWNGRSPNASDWNASSWKSANTCSGASARTSTTGWASN
ncbi:MAG: hypothetical protein DME21_06225, partial [Verrucomicrobia bacterium]